MCICTVKYIWQQGRDLINRGQTQFPKQNFYKHKNQEKARGVFMCPLNRFISYQGNMPWGNKRRRETYLNKGNELVNNQKCPLCTLTFLLSREGGRGHKNKSVKIYP